MMRAPRSGKKPLPPKPLRAVLTRAVRGRARPSEARFTATFTVGRGAECDLQVLDASVAPHHVQVIFDGMLWWARDLGAAAGTYVKGARVQVVPLSDSLELELGRGGPLLSMTVSRRDEDCSEVTASGGEARRTEAGGFGSETQIIERYLRPPGDAPAGSQTMMFRRAFERVHGRSSRRYRIVIGVALLFLICAGGLAAYQHRKLQALRATAERLFYSSRAAELETAKLEQIALLQANRQQLAELARRRARFKQLEQEYNLFVEQLGVYARLPDDERVILRVARAFGECEVNVPKGFVAEVRRYVERWRSTDRLAKALKKLKQLGYAPGMARAFTESNLPTQYIYLALQESGFDERAVGPATRFGFAKGMWQFIAPTAHRYGLGIGPKHDQPVYDPYDERFDWEKATAAAVRYIGELSSTEAQGSGHIAVNRSSPGDAAQTSPRYASGSHWTGAGAPRSVLIPAAHLEERSATEQP